MNEEGNVICDTFEGIQEHIKEGIGKFARLANPEEQKSIFIKRVDDILSIEEDNPIEHYKAILGLIVMYNRNMDMTGELLSYDEIIAEDA